MTGVGGVNLTKAQMMKDLPKNLYNGVEKPAEIPFMGQSICGQALFLIGNRV